MATRCARLAAPRCSSLGEFLEAQVGGWVPNLHILPFYPYSSDDGFSVIDYMRVDEQLGHLGRYQALEPGLRIDVRCRYQPHLKPERLVQELLDRAISPYTGYFIEVDPAQDLSQVFRPRTLPLLTAVQVGQETRHVWTTFSADQVDLNYANPQVLLEILDVLLFYLANQASFIRLDAIAFLWKEIGTPCLHLPQTHAVVKLIHALCEVVAPGRS